MNSDLICRIDHYVQKKDFRGTFKGLINQGNWKEINFVTSLAGMVRGGHYHKKTEELFIMIEGKVTISAQLVLDTVRVGAIKEYAFQKGDVFKVHKMVCHTFKILQSSAWLNVLSIPFNEQEPDFFIPVK